MTTGTEPVTTKSEVKYLGVTLDTKLNFGPHLRNVAQRTAEKVKAYGRLMANTKRPRQKIKQLLMAVTHLILRYVAEVWADAMDFRKYRKCVLTVQQLGALCIVCAYRTISEAAELVISGVIPLDLGKRQVEIDETTDTDDRPVGRVEPWGGGFLPNPVLTRVLPAVPLHDE